MLVFVSDLHLTDGTTIDSMKPGAFRIFCEMIEDIVSRSAAEEVTIVMLGDILDCLRSNVWLHTDLRPWSDPSESDARGRNLEMLASEITRKITEHPPNIESIACLNDLKETLAHKGVNLRIEFLMGNHDRLLNLFSGSRKLLADFLGLEHTPNYPLPAHKLWREHRTFARHGHVYDPINHDGESEPSSLGDAIVIQLLNRFPADLEKELGDKTPYSDLLQSFHEIDNVRPLLDIPVFIDSACKRYGNRETTRKVKRVWNSLVEEFIDLPFVTEHDRPLRWDLVNSLKAALFLTRKMSLGKIAKAVSNRRLRKLYLKPHKLAGKAVEEDAFKNGEADLIVYGHTHREVVLPLGTSQYPRDTRQRFYFNTGTWRKVLERTLIGEPRDCFAHRNVMTFVCIFKDGERTSSDGTARQFETWTGSLA